MNFLVKLLVFIYLVNTITSPPIETLAVNPTNEDIFRSEIRRNNTLPIFANMTENNNTAPLNNTMPMNNTMPLNNSPTANATASSSSLNMNMTALNASANASAPSMNSTALNASATSSAPNLNSTARDATAAATVNSYATAGANNTNVNASSILPQFNYTDDLTVSTESTLFKRIYKGNIKSFLELNKDVKYFGNNTCSILRGSSGISDMAKYKIFLIGSSNDNLNMFLISENMASIPNGNLMQVDVKNRRMKKIPITGLPSNIAFHPLGLYVYKDKLLYVINSAFNKGGQRIEVFALSDKLGNIYLKYLKSILLNESFMGIISDLAVINEDQFYITTEYPTPDNSIRGRNHTEGYIDDLMGNIAQDLKTTFVYYCDVGDNNKADCKANQQTGSLMNKGLAFDGKNKLFVSSFIDRMLRIYEINMNDLNDLKLIKTINSDYALSDINYDEREQKIYGGLAGKVNEFIDFIKAVNETKKLPDNINYSGGAMSYDIMADKIDYLLNQNVFYGINSAILRDGNIVMSSLFDNGVLICKK
jgi:hypothetical protein